MQYNFFFLVFLESGQATCAIATMREAHISFQLTSLSS